MSKIKNFDTFNEAWYDIFKSKEPKRLKFTQEELELITGELSNLISNYDAQHSNGDVTTRNFAPKKSKKEYLIIDLRSRSHFAKRETLHLQCFKTRFYDNGKFLIRYHFGGDVVSDKIETLEEFIKRLRRIIVIWKISTVIFPGGMIDIRLKVMARWLEDYNVLRDGKIVEFRLKEMIDEISDQKAAMSFRKEGGFGKFSTSPSKTYQDEHETIIGRLKEMNLELI